MDTLIQLMQILLLTCLHAASSCRQIPNNNIDFFDLKCTMLIFTYTYGYDELSLISATMEAASAI